jgi:hypothetical protein
MAAFQTPRRFRTILFACTVAILAISGSGLTTQAALEQPERSVHADGVMFTLNHVTRRDTSTIVTYTITTDGGAVFEQTGIVARRANGRIVYPRRIAFINQTRRRAYFPAFPRNEAVRLQLQPVVIGVSPAPEVQFFIDGERFSALKPGEVLSINHEFALAGDDLMVTTLTKLSYGVSIRIENVMPDPTGRVMLYYPGGEDVMLWDHRGSTFHLISSDTNLRKIDPHDSTIMVAGGNTLTFAGTISPSATTLTVQPTAYAVLHTGPWMIELT